MAKKNYRADNTYLIEGNSGDNPKLMGRALSDGRDSLYLEFYFGKVEVTSRNGTTYQKNERRNEMLGLYLWQAPRTQMERQQNKETLEVAKRIRFERGQELLERAEGYRLKKNKDIDFLKWMWAYYEEYTKADKRHIKRAYNCFVDYLIDPDGELTPNEDWDDEQREKAAKDRAKRIRGLKLKPQQLTKEMIAGFTDYLQRRFRGDGPHTLYGRFKKVIKAAVEADIIHKNPCTGVVIKIDNGALKKDVLGIDEIQQLISTHYDGENSEIRRAFIFCLY